MSNKVFEDAPQRVVGAKPTNTAIDKVRKQARQLAYDIRYKVKGKFKEGQKTSPEALKRAYMQQLGASSAPGPVKELAKKMLIGEAYDMTDISSSLVGLRESVFSNVFSEGKSVVLRVTDLKAKTTYYRSYSTYEAASAKKRELEKKGLKVEITGRKDDDAYDRKGGEKKAKKDYDGDGKIESGTAEYMGSRDKAIKKAMAKEEVIYEKDENGKKLDVMKGKNKIVINPSILENATQYFYDQGYNEEDILIISEGMGYDMFLEFVNEIGSTICLYEDVQGELLTKKGTARKNPKITKAAGTASEISPNKPKETKKPEAKKSSPGQLSIDYNKKPSPPGQERIKQGIQTAVKKATSPEGKRKIGGAVKGAANTAARAALSAWKGHQAAMKKRVQGKSLASQIGSGASTAVGSFFKKGTKHLENYEPTISERIRAELTALSAQRVEEANSTAKSTKPSSEDEREKKEREIRQMMRAHSQKQLRTASGRSYNEEAGEVRYCPKCGKDETREECKYGGEYWDENSKPAEVMDSREIPARINLGKNKLRSMGIRIY